MVWITLLALALMSVAVFVAAEYAHGIRAGEKRSLLAVAIAAVLFVLTLPLLVKYPPSGEGFARFVAVAIASLTGFACFWFTKSHIDRARPLGAFLSTIFGLAMFGLGFILWFGQPAPATADGSADPADVLAALTPEAKLARQQERLVEQQRGLEDRLLVTIPDARRQFRQQAGEVQRALVNASSAMRPQLENEMKEIARQLLAVDREEVRTRDLIERVKQEQRRLQRLATSQNLSGDLASLDDDLDQLWRDTQQQINASIDSSVDIGAINELELQSKVSELMNAPGAGSPGPAPGGGGATGG